MTFSEVRWPRNQNVCNLHTCDQTLRPLAPNTATIVLVMASEVDMDKVITELTHMTKLFSSFTMMEGDAGEWQQENTGARLRGELRCDKLCICTRGQPDPKGHYQR